MPTLQIWMAPFVSMTMQEKLGLLKTALCRAFAFNNASSAFLRAALPGNADVDYGNMKFRFFIAFDALEFLGGQPAVSVLNAMASEVERILAAIEAECRRIGIV
jgi:hypothetical protein